MNGYAVLDLDKIRGSVAIQETPFPHQLEAFEKLNKVFTMPIRGYKASLLVLPTGSGKTFTATNWISRNALSRNVKILWMAQSSFLLDQATQSFIKESSSINPLRKQLIIRTVSSSRSHANSGSIELSDDIVITTTQTAISDVLNENIGFKGEPLKYRLGQWVDNCKNSELFVILDEAHHAPAYGCRTLLTKLRDIIPNLYILGLTATPTHNDPRIRGWLGKIFESGICYEANRNNLYKTNILAKPVYIPKPTGRDMEVDDKLFDRLVREHKDLPESIIDILARDSERNNFIVRDYIQNKNDYGKTIIFADRWFQCEYIVEKLKESKIRADSVYSMSSGKKDMPLDGQGTKDNKKNELTLKNFRDGKLDVLVNVKMLTEGVDVPDVKTVMITRNTTSGILFNQMLGRSLRGKKAGGGPNKDKANIVMFVDNWKRLLPFVDCADLSGGSDGTREIRAGVPPMEWISILLVRRACKDIDFVGREALPCRYYIPGGWYETSYTVAVTNEDDEEMITTNNSVMVYETNKGAFERLIHFLLTTKMPDIWSSENITAGKIIDGLASKLAGIIDLEKDDVDGRLKSSIVDIVRHVAQNATAPEFIPFEVRDRYDVDLLVDKYSDLTMPQLMVRLRADFDDTRLLWGSLYKKFDWFWQAYSDAMLRSNCGHSSIKDLGPEQEELERQPENYRRALLARDNNQCRCCGRQLGRGVRLQNDHIVPRKMGGKTVLDNLQLLCKECNLEKGDQLINFLNNKTSLESPREFRIILSRAQELMDCSVTRIINFFYKCSAVCNILYSQRRNGKHYHVWTVYLHEGNPIDWLLPHKTDLLRYIQEELLWSNVQDIKIETIVKVRQ